MFNGANGIAKTAKEATVYSGGSSADAQAPTTPGTPTASSVTANSATLTWTAATDNVGVTGYDVVRVNGGDETRVATSTTSTATVSGLTAETDYTFAVHAHDAAGNRSARSATVNVTTGKAASTSCAVGYRVVGEWPGGFQGEIKIGNPGTAAINGWKLAFTFADGQSVTNMWGGTPTQSGGAVSVAPASYTNTIAAGGSVTVGFIANKGATNTAPRAFTLNGSACSSS